VSKEVGPGEEGAACMCWRGGAREEEWTGGATDNATSVDAEIDPHRRRLGAIYSASLHTMGNTGCGLRRHGGSGI